jgi:hypothetical protein
MEKVKKLKEEVATTATETTASPEAKEKPKQFREGDCSVSIWKREVRGRTYYSASFERSYKSDSGWKYSRYFGADELGAVASLAKQASDYLHGLPDRDQD